MSDFITTEVLTAFLALIAAVVGPVVGIAANAITRKTGLEISDRQRALVRSAIVTGISRAISGGATYEDAIRRGVQWAEGPGAGDTVKANAKTFTEGALRGIAEAEIGPVMQRLGVLNRIKD